MTLNGNTSNLRKHLSGLELSEKRSHSSEHINQECDDEVSNSNMKNNLISKSREGIDRRISANSNILEERSLRSNNGGSKLKKNLDKQIKESYTTANQESGYRK